MGVRKRRVLRAAQNSLRDPIDLGSLDPDWSGFVLYKGTLGIPECPWTVRPGEVVSIPIRMQQLRAVEQQLANLPPPPPVPTVDQLRAMTLQELDRYCSAAYAIKDEAWRMYLQRRDEASTRLREEYQLEQEARQLARKAMWAEKRAAKAAAKVARDAKRRKPRVDFYFGAAVSPAAETP